MILSFSRRCTPFLFRETRDGGHLPEDCTGICAFFRKRERVPGKRLYHRLLKCIL